MPLIEKTTKIPAKNSLWPQNKSAEDNTTTILIIIDDELRKHNRNKLLKTSYLNDL